MSRLAVGPIMQQLASGGGDGTYAGEVLADGPVAFWRLDETSGSTIADSTGNGYTGTVYGATLGDLSSPNSTGASFDGTNDYIDIGAQSALNFTTAFTIEAWVFADNLIGENAVAVSNGDLGWTLRFSRFSPTDQWECIRRTSSTWRAPATTLGGRGSWQHVAATFSTSAGIQLYVNGVADGTDADTNATNAPSTATLIGADSQSGPRRFFRGKIADVAVYNKALTGTRILAHYDARGL